MPQKDARAVPHPWPEITAARTDSFAEKKGKRQKAKGKRQKDKG